MECKYTGASGTWAITEELIDTLWNVNSENQLNAVNTLTRINRYIMECKCHSASYPLCSISELIDTLWNVNCHVLAQYFPPPPN